MISSRDQFVLLKSQISTGKDITVMDVEEWVRNKNMQLISDFIYERHYSRYLKIFDFNQKDFAKQYKNGFAIMANCCLMIETIESFVRGWPSTNGKSEMAFLKFFTRLAAFSEFSTDDMPSQFYRHIRCGILHQGETTGGWRITRQANLSLLDKKNKIINATKFHSSIKSALTNYKKDLMACSWNDTLCQNAIKKLKAVIINCE